MKIVCSSIALQNKIASIIIHYIYGLDDQATKTIALKKISDLPNCPDNC